MTSGSFAISGLRISDASTLEPSLLEGTKLFRGRASGGTARVLGERQIVDVQREIEQQEHFISVLLGRNPGAIPRGRALTDQPHAPDVPAGLPSALAGSPP